MTEQNPPHPHVISNTVLDNISAADLTIPKDLVISLSPSEPLVTINPDGTIEFGPNYTPDAAAQAFWDGIRRWAWSPTAMSVAGLHASEAAASAWGTVWLCGNWRSLTGQMEDEAREIAASGVLRWMHGLDDEDGRPHRAEPPELRWWRG